MPSFQFSDGSFDHDGFCVSEVSADFPVGWPGGAPSSQEADSVSITAKICLFRSHMGGETLSHVGTGSALTRRERFLSNSVRGAMPTLAASQSASRRVK